MNRATFLICYLLLALFCSGAGFLIRNFPSENLWTPTYVFSAFAAVGTGVLTNPKIIVPVAVVIAMIVIARSRGQRIGKPWLVWLPVAALSLSGVRAMYPQAQLGYVFAYLIAFGPIILHLVCVVLGVAHGDAPRATMSQAPPDMPTPTARVWQVTKYLGIALLLGVIYVTNFGLYPRYFDIAWDEEVQLHDGRVIVVNRKRTFERRGLRLSRYDESQTTFRRNQFTFDAGTQKIVFSTRMPVAYLGEVEGNWYAVISGQGPYGNYPDEMPNHWGSDYTTLEQRLAILKDGKFIPKGWENAPTELIRMNLLPSCPLEKLIELRDTKITLDQKIALEKAYPSSYQRQITRPLQMTNNQRDIK